VRAAADVTSRILQSAEMLSTFPHLGRVFDGEVRVLRVPGLPYSIYYETDAEDVTILTVFHDKQRAPRFMPGSKS